MTLCKHDKHKTIDWVRAPKWSTDEVLINTDAVTPDIEHYLVRFTDPSPQKKYGWFYLSGKVIRRHKIVPNGRGRCYVVPMMKRETFNPVKECEHGRK